MEEKKKKLEKLYHEMLKNIQDYGVILLDVDGTVLTWNKGAQEIKGYKAEEIIGKNFRVLKKSLPLGDRGKKFDFSKKISKTFEFLVSWEFSARQTRI